MTIPMREQLRGAAANVGARPLRSALVGWAALIKESLGTLFAVIDQGILSTANIITTVVVGRALGAADLGVLSLQFGLIFIAVALLDATLCTTLIGRRASTAAAELSLLSGQFLLLTALFSAAWAVAAVGAVLYVSGRSPLTDPTLMLSVGLVFPAYLLRDFIRRSELAFSRPGSALVVDGVAALCQFIPMALIWYLDRLTLEGCLLSVAFGNFVGLALGLLRWSSAFTLRYSDLPGILRQVVHESRWVVAALFLFMLSLQLMPWLVTLTSGVEAAGYYTACVVVANAANPLVTGFINAMMPKAALQFADTNRGRSMPRALRIEVGALVGVTGAVAAASAIFAPELLQGIYGEAFVPYAGLLAILSLSFLVRSLGAAPYIGLWALGRADRNAAINLAMVVIAVAMALLLTPALGVFGAGIGVLIGDVTGVSARWVLFARFAQVKGSLA